MMESHLYEYQNTTLKEGKVIDLTKELNKLYQIKIDGKKIKDIINKSLNKFKGEVLKRISEGLFSGDLLLDSCEQIFEIMDSFLEVEFDSENVFINAINRYRTDIYSTAFKSISKNKNGLKEFKLFFQEVTFGLCELIVAAVLKDYVFSKYPFKKYSIYISDFNFDITKKFIKDADMVYYDKTLYYKEKEIITNLHSQTYEVEKYPNDESTSLLLNDSATNKLSSINKRELVNKNTNYQSICFKFNHLIDLSIPNLNNLVDSYYYEINYFNRSFLTREELENFYQKIKRKISNKPIVFNFFRFDTVKYAFNLDDDYLTKKNILNHILLFKEELEKIFLIFQKNQVKLLIPAISSPSVYEEIKDFIDQLVGHRTDCGIGVEYDNSYVQYDEFKKFNFSILNIDRFIEEYYHDSDLSNKELNKFQINILKGLHQLSSRKHKNDYISGYALSNPKILESIRKIKFDNIILNKNQIKQLIKQET